MGQTAKRNASIQSREQQPEHQPVPSNQRPPMPAAHGVNHEDLLFLTRELAQNTRAIAELATEVRSLRQERQPASSAILEELCGAIYDLCGRKPFTSALVFELALDSIDAATSRLSEILIRATGPEPDVHGVARLLTRACGANGSWRLTLHKAHSNQGKLFRIEKQ